MSAVPEWRNWGGNQRHQPAAVVYPADVGEVVAAVRSAAARGRRVKVAGAGHSFTGVAATDGVHVHLDRLRRILEADRDTGLVSVQAGISLRRLSEALAARGLALENMGDIDSQSLAGAISTSTHGTGARYGGLATQVAALEMVTASGEVLRCSESEEPEVFAAARVGLGALGVITAVTLRCVPAFTLHAVEDVGSLDDMLAALEAHDHAEGYWIPHTERALIKRNDRSGEPPSGRGRPGWFRDRILVENVIFGAACEAGARFPSLTPHLARLAASGGRREFTDRSDRVFTTPRWVRFVETEWALPRAALGEALNDLVCWHQGSALAMSFPVEVRVAAADDVWLSTAYGRDTAYIAAHAYCGWKGERGGADQRRWFAAVESIMAPAGGRPHWGKLHNLDASALAPRYPRWDDWQAVRRRLDPEGRFANRELDRVLGPPG